LAQAFLNRALLGLGVCSSCEAYNLTMGAFLIVVDRSGRVLVHLRKSRRHPGPGLPGGGFDRRKDRNEKDTAIRECAEEAGVFADPRHVKHLRGHYYWVEWEHCRTQRGKSSHYGESKPIHKLKRWIRCEEEPSCWQHAWVRKAEIARTSDYWNWRNAPRAIAASEMRNGDDEDESDEDGSDEDDSDEDDSDEESDEDESD